MGEPVTATEKRSNREGFVRFETNVFAKDGPAGELITLGQTDALGSIVIPSSDHAIRTLYIKCGAKLVAIPTAIPLAPLASRFGKVAGKTTGSVRVPS